MFMPSFRVIAGCWLIQVHGHRDPDHFFFSAHVSMNLYGIASINHNVHSIYSRAFIHSLHFSSSSCGGRIHYPTVPVTSYPRTCCSYLGLSSRRPISPSKTASMSISLSWMAFCHTPFGRKSFLCSSDHHWCGSACRIQKGVRGMSMKGWTSAMWVDCCTTRLFIITKKAVYYNKDTAVPAFDNVNPETAAAFSFPLIFGCQTHLTGLFKTQLADGIMVGMDNAAASFWSQMFTAHKISVQRL
jgi:hypothetical protein